MPIDVIKLKRETRNSFLPSKAPIRKATTRFLRKKMNEMKLCIQGYHLILMMIPDIHN